jgi:hypothetical protein
VIYFVADALSIEDAIRHVASSYSGLAKHVRFVEYSQLLSTERMQKGTYVFTGTLRFDEVRIKIVVPLEKALVAGGSKLLNPPSAQLQRAIAVNKRLGGYRPDEVDGSNDEFQVRLCSRPPYRLQVAQSGSDLALSIAEEILDYGTAADIRLWKGEPEVTTTLCIGGNHIQLTPGPSLIAATPTELGFDLVCLESAVHEGMEQLVCATDALPYLLPAVPPGSSLAAAVTCSILSLDSMEESKLANQDFSPVF